MPHAKKFYTDMAGVLIPLATFAGGLTLATQFIIQCPGSRLEALHQMASQLFLATPIVLGEFLGYIQHSVVVAQFVTAGIMLGIAFLLLGYALLSAQVGPRAIGIWGIILLGVVILVALISGAIAAGLISQWCGGLRKSENKNDKGKGIAFSLGKKHFSH